MPLAAFLEAHSVRLRVFFLPERMERGKRIIGNSEQCGVIFRIKVTVTEQIAGLGYMGGYVAGLVDCVVKRSGKKQETSTAESGSMLRYASFRGRYRFGFAVGRTMLIVM